MNLSSWQDPENGYYTNPIAYLFFWARSKYHNLKFSLGTYKYSLLCKIGYHITYDEVTVATSGLKGNTVLKRFRRPIKYCRRCKQEVNKGIKSFYDDKKRLTNSVMEV